MKANELLSKIPIVPGGINQGKSIYWARIASQYGAIAALILIPLSGLFRIDFSAGFIVLGRQIWFSDFSIVFGFWLAVACLLILLYSTVGTAFCGWVCPQNTMSSLANLLTFKHLGKRAAIDWETKKGIVAANKNKILNWVLISIKFILISLGLALIPMFYFYPPEVIWSFVTFAPDDRLAGSLHWIYFVFVFIILVNIAVVRHFACRYMCIYRMWQFLFKTKDTLHIDYDASRAEECKKCNYCQTSCMVDIDPRKTSTYDSCTNCGACITACDQLHEKTGEKGLLRFRLGTRRNVNVTDKRRSMPGLRQRALWVLPILIFALAIFSWGLATYQPYHLSVYRSDVADASQINEYRINLASKMANPVSMKIEVEGLDPSVFHLSKNVVSFDSYGRQDVSVRITGALKPGVYGFFVKASTDNGWVQTARVQHVVTRG